MILLPVTPSPGAPFTAFAELGPEALDQIVEYISHQKASSEKIAELATELEEKPMSMMDVYEAEMKGENPFLKALADGFAAKDAEITKLKKKLDDATKEKIDLVRGNNRLISKLDDLQNCGNSDNLDACGECIKCREVSFNDAILQRNRYRAAAVDATKLLSDIHLQLSTANIEAIAACIRKNQGL